MRDLQQLQKKALENEVVIAILYVQLNMTVDLSVSFPALPQPQSSLSLSLSFSKTNFSFNPFFVFAVRCFLELVGCECDMFCVALVASWWCYLRLLDVSCLARSLVELFLCTIVGF